MRRARFPGVVVLLLAVVLLLTATRGWTQAKPPISVALVAAMSGGSALSGEAIKRGLSVAIDEINARGGLLGGRKVELVIRDEEGNPSKGVTAARDVIEREGAVAVFGGLHSPVGLAMLPVFHELKVPYVGTWAAATGITRNGRNPNFMFRVSANDDIVDHFLAKHVIEKLGKQKPGVILENTPWGASNQEGLTKWFGKLGAQPVGFEKFNWNDPDMSAQLLRLRNGGADALVMVANAPEGAQVVRSRAKIGWSVPTVSHWGISGGRFAELTGDLSESVVFVQTYSFFGKQSEAGERVIAALKTKYAIKGPEDILAPVGTANAYDAMHLVALAVERAGAADGARIRDALETLGEYRGLIKTYRRPFTPEEHDALNEDDYILVTWRQGKIVPVSTK
ncbi:MAG: ethanolamine utilization protein EutN [Cyanobacteria bacterium 13_1_40CM_2_61_4]|nr:MAG: ethanolamine utilization protein EutN [Cyanobacteria bacterium 13_1_40CM_2_61_4]